METELKLLTFSSCVSVLLHFADAMETEVKLLTFSSCVSLVAFCRCHGNRAEVADVFITCFSCCILQMLWKQS